ncbi:MAG: cysteine desulfurase [Bacteroidales bacterium]|nr:cysteine desulfurase [Bacteroidales bacterium]
MTFDINKIRSDFPILQRKIYDKPLIYLDNAATTQKPQIVIDRITDYYTYENANIHRGVHYLSQIDTTAFENAREYIARFINAPKKEEVIFTKGTTESINLVAASFGRKILNKDDEVLVTAMEHHSNLVPWQMLCYEKEARLKVIPYSDKGEINLSTYQMMLGDKTKIVALPHISNTLGSINPVKEMIRMAHEKNIPVLIDGAQALSHLKVDIADLDCDFYCCSGHKAYGPMGVGILYGKTEHLNFMDPYQTGGEMVEHVTLYETSFNEIPFKFEAGTPNVEAVLGMEAALHYVEETGLDEITAHEKNLLVYGTKKLQQIKGVQIYGKAAEKAGILSFLIDDIHSFDAGTIIDKFGIAIRTGHHCAQPVMNKFGIPGTVRASFAMYNTREEIDKLVEAILQVKKMFG